MSDAESGRVDPLVSVRQWDSSDNVFCRRKRDGKYYRGAKLWRWTRYWRFAAVLPFGSWIVGIKFDEPVEFVGLNELE